MQGETLAQYFVVSFVRIAGYVPNIKVMITLVFLFVLD